MTQKDPLLLVYTTHASVAAAKKIGKQLLENRLAACVNIIPSIQPMFFWPPQTGNIDETSEVAMIIKTLESKYPALEQAIIQLHPDDVPCVIAWPAPKVNAAYYAWIAGELR